MQRKLLEIKDVSKSFSGVKVFSDFNFDLYSGEVHCICGENGAGKSTFIKILSGALQPDTGEIVIDGEKVDALAPHLSMELGIQTIYQENTLFQNLSVTENLFVGKEYTKSTFIVDKTLMQKKAAEVFDFLDWKVDTAAIVHYLGATEQKIVEIAKALIQQAKVLIMDEPTAALGKEEIDKLFVTIEKVKEQGVGIIYISHHMDEVFKLADRVTVIRDGHKINTYQAVGIDEDTIIKDMVGRDASLFYNRERTPIGETLLKVEGLSGNGVFNISFKLRRGEIVGIAGVTGAGRTELAELIFGRVPKSAGSLYINEQPCAINSPADSIQNGMCLLTEDRKLTGLFLEQTVSYNTVIAHLSKSKAALVSPQHHDRVTHDFINKFKIRTRGADQLAQFLSGGNQQKVILAKWFYTDADIFIFDEPTKGIDIGAKEDIYLFMVELLKQGKGIIMVSSDMPELIAMSDKVLVMRQGKVVGRLTDSELTEESILSLSLGGKADESRLGHS